MLQTITFSELLPAWVEYYSLPSLDMDARIVKAIVDGDVGLAKESIAASEVNDLNQVFRTYGNKPYTILDATFDEINSLNNTNKKAAVRQIILELRRGGAKTFKELSVQNLRPPFSVTRTKKRGRSEGIALSRKNKGRNNTFFRKNMWNEGI